jgi:spore coat protein H
VADGGLQEDIVEGMHQQDDAGTGRVVPSLLDAALGDGGAGAGDAAPAPGPCQPTGDGPYAVLEGELLFFQLRCATGARASQFGLAFDPLPVGATWEPESNIIRWRPALDQAAVYELPIRAGVSNETGRVKVGVVDRWWDAANEPVVDELTYTEEYGLPVLHLHVDPGLNNDIYTPAQVVYRGHAYGGVQAQGRGAFSRNFPKRSYTLKFTKNDKFNEPVFAGGFRKKRKITLVTTFNDNSYLRTRLGFELWNKLDPEHILVQSYSAVVYLDGVYVGLYTVVDHIDEYLMEDFGLSQEGNLYKARTHDANFKLTAELGAEKTSLHLGYTKEEGTPADGEPGAYDDLDELVRWVATATPESFRDEVDRRLVRKEYEDWWLFVTFIMANDSIGKNSYHYHDPAMPGSRWRYIPWDLDESMGQDYKTSRLSPGYNMPEDKRFLVYNNLAARLLAEPTIGPTLRARYGATLAGAFSVANINAMIDAMAAEIKLSAERDEGRWGERFRNYYIWNTRTDFRSHGEEVQYLREWITQRHALLDAVY